MSRFQHMRRTAPDDDKTSPRLWFGPVSSCLVATIVLGISVGLLFCNSLTSFVIYAAIPKTQDQAVMAAVTQLFFYLMPIALTFLEWHLIDRVLRLFQR